MRDIAIIGSGPAGYTAAIYAARAGREPILFTGMQPGGQLMITTEVDNFPGFPEGIQGPDLMLQMRAQAERMGALIVDETVERLEYDDPAESGDSGQPIFVLHHNSTHMLARAVILATGASAKWLGIPGEGRLQGKGVSACATCDGFFFRNKVVAVVGGGDTAMEEAVYLSKLCKLVYLIHRRNEFRASAAMVRRAEEIENIRFVTGFAPVSIEGEEKVESIALETWNSPRHQTQSLPVDGVFIAIGHKPNSDLLLDLNKEDYFLLDQGGYVVTEKGSTRTDVPGLFAAGDVADPVYRQAVTSAGSGCMAAIDADHFLAGRL